MFTVDIVCFFFFKQKTAYEMRISDWSSDVCSSDLLPDDEFEERLPSLDADAFTARPAPTTAADPPALAEPLPPVDDELSAPLTPLPVFDVTPAPAGQQQAASDQPPAVSYRLRVGGSDGDRQSRRPTSRH